MTRRILALVAFCAAAALAARLQAETRPNFLIIIADDCTFNDLPIYGGKNARTPNLDRLAREGLTFNRAYLGSAMCQPCRAELYTGLYPLRNGCAWNHSASRPTTKSLPHLLQPLGYQVGLAGKIHVRPGEAFPFERIAGFDRNAVRNPTEPHDLAGLREFMTTPGDGPFCLIVALVEPHVPWVMGDASQYPPEEIALPPNLADTPETRRHFADYLAEITYMDGQVGEILAALDDSAHADDTLVLFTSEQGSQFPGNKWTNWDTGVHTALVARWPGHVAAAQRTDALVQYADVAPTLLELGGGSAGDRFDGTSFAAVLRGEANVHRKYAYAMHNNLPEGPPYPIRSVTDGRFHYIRNLRPAELYVEKHLMGGGPLNNPYWASWLGADPIRQPRVYQQTRRYMQRPPEQLYAVDDDPYELVNLAADARHAKTKQRLSDALDVWMTSQADPGAAVDAPDALEAARNGRHLYGVEFTHP